MERTITEKEFKEFTSEIITGLVSALIDNKNYEDLGTFPAVAAAAFELLKERIFDGEDTDETETPEVSCEAKKRKIIIEEADEGDLPDWLKAVLDTIAEQAVKGTLS